MADPQFQFLPTIAWNGGPIYIDRRNNDSRRGARTRRWQRGGSDRLQTHAERNRRGLRRERTPRQFGQLICWRKRRAWQFLECGLRVRRDRVFPPRLYDLLIQRLQI